MVEWVSAVGSLLAGIAALVAVDLARKQLTNLNRTLRQTVVASVIQLETELTARKMRVDEAAIRMLELIGEGKPLEEIERAKRMLEASMENWLNGCDRLAFLIVRKYVKEKEWRTEYENYFRGLIANHPDRFCPGSIYDNVRELAERWKIPLPS